MFEGFKAKVHEVLETGKAEKSMTFEQGLNSKYREKLAEEFKKTGIEVEDDIEVEVVVPKNEYAGRSITRSYINQYHVTGTFDGKRIEFWLDEMNVVMNQAFRAVDMRNFRCIVDGVELPSEAVAKGEVKKVLDAAIAARDLLEFDRTHSAT